MAITRAAGVPLIVNDRPDLCALVGAAGVHLGQADMPVDQARSIVGPERAIGVSTHSLEEAIRADAQDVDYIAIGPVFPTPSKEMSIEAIGPEVLGEVVAAVRAPVVAIGGITADNMAAGTEVRKPALYVKTIITKRIADGDFGPAAHRRPGEVDSEAQRRKYLA